MGAPTIAVVAETALDSSDLAQLDGLYGKDIKLEVLVPVTDGEPRLLAALDHIVLGELGDAWSALRGKDPDAAGLAGATRILDESLAAARAAGLAAEGQVVPGDPIAALVQTIDSTKAQAAVFITLPHLVGDSLHEDWAAKARRTLGIPVIHFYGGTTKLLS
ncbi:MAG: hypothetical protein LBD97_07170 [Bifidobacteriaceae bacterium]|jgi:hypothetical protein|nr:hypothetical protein [Bifidobacteriaceae bacterium]